MKRLSVRTISLASLALAWFAGINAEAAPITFASALPVGKDEIILREQFQYARSSRGAIEREEHTLLNVFVAGLSADWTFIASLPVSDLSLKGDDPFKHSATGLKDGSLLLRYTAFKKNMRGGTFRIAPFAGLELPTGDHRTQGVADLRPEPLQLGSAGVDLIAGATLTYARVDHVLDAQVVYKATSAANGLDYGDEFRIDGSWQYRLLPRDLSSEFRGFTFAVLEANLIHEGATRTGTFLDKNTGGTRFFLSPGIQYATQRWVAEFGVQIPVFQANIGLGLKQDYSVRTGLRISF